MLKLFLMQLSLYMLNWHLSDNSIHSSNSFQYTLTRPLVKIENKHCADSWTH